MNRDWWKAVGWVIIAVALALFWWAAIHILGGRG